MYKSKSDIYMFLCTYTHTLKICLLLYDIHRHGKISVLESLKKNMNR